MEAAELSHEEMILTFLAEGGDEFVSGATLSDKLGLSRTAVWKHVETLRGLGYRIEAAPARGYRLLEVPDRLTALELAPLLSTRDLGRQIHALDSVGSTNEVAFELASEGAFHGEVVVAESQTAGKGRRGRTWESPPGKSLYCSIILRPELVPQRAPELTLVAAVALAETLREADVEASIKWPNDVEVDGRKIAGILTELSAEADRVRFVVVGIGVNLNLDVDDFPETLQDTATSVKVARGNQVPRALFTAALFTKLEQWLERHATEGFTPVRSAWKALSSTLGSEVLVRSERQELTGVAEDLDESGALLVRTKAGGLEKVIAGDVEQLRTRR